jgi:hypothetical protein
MLVSPLDVPAVAVVAFVGSFVYARFLKPRNPDWYAFIGVGTVVLFWLHAVATAAGVSPLGVEVESNVVAVLYVLSYPMWFRWASERAFVLFGRGPEQGGIAWVLRIKDTTEGFGPDWEKE